MFASVLKGGRALAIAVMIAFPGVSGAQSGPVFELQPGFSVSEFLSVPEGTHTNSAFSIRFSTRFPTSHRWLTPVVGAVFLPYGSTENTIRNTDAPTLFIGNIFPLISAEKTAGWLSIEVPLLLAHSPGTGSTGNIRDYGRDLVISPTVNLHIGAKLLPEFGTIWSRLNVFTQVEQNLTPNRDPAAGDRDFFNPVATFGLALMIGSGRD